MIRKFFDHHNKNGILLVSMMFMFTLVILAGVFMFGIISNGRAISGQVDRVQALYTAYAGIQRAIAYLGSTDPAGNTDGSWRTTACTPVAGVCTTAAGNCATGNPCKEVLTTPGGTYGAYTMWVETSTSDIKITAEGKYPTDSSGNSITGTITKTLQTKVDYRSYLEMWWKLDDTYGYRASDSASSSALTYYTGNYWGWITNVTTAKWYSTSGVTGAGALWYTGTTQYTKTWYPLTPINKAFTISMWVKPDTASANAIEALFVDYTNKTGLYWITSSTLEWIDVNSNVTTASTTLNLNTWYHIVVTNDTSNTLAIYVNGVEETYNGGGAVTNTGMGALNALGNDSAVKYFKGYFDDVRFYSRAFSPFGTEISDIYNGGAGSQTTNLPIAWGYIALVPRSWSEDNPS